MDEFLKAVRQYNKLMSKVIKNRSKMEDSVLTVRECAKYLQVSECTIRRLVKEGWIPYFRIGRAIRFRLRSMEHYLMTVR